MRALATKQAVTAASHGKGGDESANRRGWRSGSKAVAHVLFKLSALLAAAAKSGYFCNDEIISPQPSHLLLPPLRINTVNYRCIGLFAFSTRSFSARA